MKAYTLLLLTLSSLLLTNCASLFEEDRDTYQDCTGFVDDGRGKYTKIKIGDQCWLKEDIQYQSNITGGYKFTTFSHNNRMYYFSSTAYEKGVCPLGYQIPSTEEWQKLGNQVYRLEDSKVGYLVYKVEIFYYKNSLTSRSSYTSRDEGKASSWLIRDSNKALAVYNSASGLVIENMPALVDDTKPVTGVGTKEYGYFSIKCIRVESFN
jgi:uncharacterized protein (TIGR02145 family)